VSSPERALLELLSEVGVRQPMQSRQAGPFRTAHWQQASLGLAVF
jgi:hypothetical protein